MSAAALRQPAHWHRVARAEARALLSSRGPLLVMAVAVLLAARPSAADRGFPWEPVANLLHLMLLFPLLHWRGAGTTRALDQATPIGPVRYELIRVGVGAAGALAALCVVALAHALTTLPQFDQAGLEGLPQGYAAALIIRGVAYYGFGSIAVFRSGGRGLGPVLLASALVLVFLEVVIGLGYQTRTDTYTHLDGTRTVTYGASLTLWKALAELAVAIAAVCASAAFGSRERGRPRLPWASRDVGAAPSRRPPPGRNGLAFPRRPTPLPRAAARELLAQGPRMMGHGVIILLLTVFSIVSTIRLGGTASRDFFLTGSFYLYLAAFFWPLLVRPHEHRGDWDLARPAGTLAQRILQWAAGLAWLELWTVLLVAIQVGAEILDGALPGATPAWVLPGVPMAAMALYCVGTLPAMVKKHPVAWSIAAWLVTFAVLGKLNDVASPSALSPARAIAPLLSHAGEWSAAAALVWLPVLAGLALAAVSIRARLDREAPARRPAPSPLLPAATP